MHYLHREDEPNILKEMKNNGYEVIWIGRNDVVPGDRPKTAYCDEYYDGVNNTNMRDASCSVINHSADMNEDSKRLYEEMRSGDTYYSFYMGKLPDGNGYGKTDWNCVEKALEFLERKQKEKSDKPFFVYCTISFPHPPYACEEPWYSAVDRIKLPPRRPNIKNLPNKASMLYGINEKQGLNGWTEERFDELRGTYLAMVSRFDHQLGMIKDKLKESGFYDDTSLIVFSDHGDYTGDYTITEKVQNCFEDPISKVPLLIKPAKEFPVQPGISSALAELVDLPATIAELSGIQLSYSQFGKSLLPALAGAKQHKDAVFCEGGRIHGEKQAMELGHGTESPYWPRLSTQSSEGPEHTKAVMCRIENYKYIMRLYEQDELYDLSSDPMEIDNLAVREEYKEFLQEMKNRITQFYMETTDFVPNKRDKR